MRKDHERLCALGKEYNPMSLPARFRRVKEDE
jgi:hypothetical protein